MKKMLPRRKSLRLLVLGVTIGALVLVGTGLYTAIAPNQAAASTGSLTILDGTAQLRRGMRADIKPR